MSSRKKTRWKKNFPTYRAILRTNCNETLCSAQRVWTERLICLRENFRDDKAKSIIHINIHIRIDINTHIHTNIHTYIQTIIHTYIYTYKHTTYIHAYIHTYLYTYIRRYTLLYIHTNQHTYIHTYIHTEKHRYIYTYIHTFIHTYIQTCTHKAKHINCRKATIFNCVHFLTGLSVEYSDSESLRLINNSAINYKPNLATQKRLKSSNEKACEISNLNFNSNPVGVKITSLKKLNPAVSRS